MDGYDMARALEAYAKDSGFIAPQAYYIVGEVNLSAQDGSSVYSNEALLWCRKCATELLYKARALMPEHRREDHMICQTDASGEDSCPHCYECGETLDGSISSYAAAEELHHYAEHPIGCGTKISARQAVEIAMVLYAARTSAEALSLGESALRSLLQPRTEDRT